MEQNMVSCKPIDDPSIPAGRIQHLNDSEMKGKTYILYWMQQSQRATDNHALAYAVHLANRCRQPLLVVFGLTDGYPGANLRHYAFMLEGLQETQATLRTKGIRMVIRKGKPPAVALDLAGEASAIVCDRGYLRHQRKWRREVARFADCPVVQVESDLVVPVETASGKAEYAARTIRPKIHKQLAKYLAPLKPDPIGRSSLDLPVGSLDPGNVDEVLRGLDIDRKIEPVSRFFKGGSSQAKARFDDFLQSRLNGYAKHSNQPQTDDISQMSPYLHFGQISPSYLALKVVNAAGIGDEDREGFLEQLIVRRELAANFAFYTPDYDAYSCLPSWAQETLREHEGDRRDYLYTRGQLAGARTHDAYWNAAMAEMRLTGFMHNYMRMYWGKKILEWSKTPRQGFRTVLALNNAYFLDGRDPNSFAGAAWVFGLHDRPWKERPVFGKVRYMAASGLERKCDIQGYVTKVASLAACTG